MEAVFKALGDPTRRLLLDRLRDQDGQTLTQLVARLEMTRFGVMKHLRVLERSGLVVTRRSGREKLHFLNAVPIRQIHDRWISRYAALWAGALDNLKRQLEEPAMKDLRHVYEIYVRATPERLWEAITRPEHTRNYFYGTLVDSTWKPGAPLVYRYPDGRVAADGTIREIDAPRRLVHTFNALWDSDVTPDRPHVVTWTIEPMGQTCRLSVEHSEFDGETPTYRSVTGGVSVILNGLKTLLETGEPLAIGR